MTALPIRVRLTAWYLAVITVTFILASLAIYFGMRTVIQRTVDKELSERTEGVHNFLWRHLPRHTRAELPREFLEHSGIHPGGDLYQVMESSRAWLYQAPSMPQLNLPVELPDSRRPPHYNTLMRQGNELRVLSSTVEVMRQQYLIQVVTVVTPLYSILSRFLWIALAMFPVVLCIAGLGGYWLSGRAMKPVYDIASAAHGISEQHLSMRLTVPEARDELRHLSETLNEMLCRLDHAFRRITQFTADASHELRTPVAVIRTTSELILARERSVEEYEELVRKILQESEVTTELIENLLTLARADANAMQMDLVPIDLSQVFRDSIPGLEALAESRGLLFSCSQDAGTIWTLADRHSFRRLIFILADNAIKYTASGGSLHLSLTATVSEAFLTVRDTGIGIPSEDLPHIFNRFYRATNVRILEVEGSGLGLPIAQWIAAAHGAAITVESSLGGGSVFLVKMPLRTDSGHLLAVPSANLLETER